MGTIRELIRQVAVAPAAEVQRLHSAHLNPTFLEAIKLVGFSRHFVRGEGMTLVDSEQRNVLDFLSNYGSMPLGHSHPDVRAAIEEVLATNVPHFLHIAAQPMAAALAQRLTRLAPGDLSMAFFTSSGSEAVEGALKLARIVTGRSRFVSTENSFHGTTLGALSVTGNEKRRKPYGQLLDCAYVPWGRADSIARELRNNDVAAVILEPIQAEGGMNMPPPGYLKEVARLCRRHGALFIVDEIQTGLGRTGHMFVCEAEQTEPDVLLVAKALSGGMAPISAYITRPDLWTKAYGTLQRYDLHCSTFSGGPISCAAALATLEVIERDRLVKKAAETGAYLGERLRAVTAEHSIVRAVRGRGLMWGIELASVGGPIGDLVAQWLVVGLLERGVLTQVCEGDGRVVRVQPALIAERAHVDQFIDALTSTLRDHSRSATGSLAGVALRAVRNQVGSVLGRSEV